jgi:elongation factor Ts
MELRRFCTLKAESNEFFVDYIHGEGKIGVIVKVKVSDPSLLDNQKVREIAFDTALHIAAYNPTFLSKDRINSEYIKEQEEIFMTQAEKLGKPENILQGIVKGKLKKHYSEICLLEQAFVKNDKMSVASVFDSLGEEVNGKIELIDFLYYRVGEEI